MCLAEYDGTGGGQELPLALTVGSPHVHSLTQNPRKSLGKRLSLDHRLWTKPETRTQKRVVSHSEIPEWKEECRTTSSKDQAAEEWPGKEEKERRARPGHCYSEKIVFVSLSWTPLTSVILRLTS